MNESELINRLFNLQPHTLNRSDNDFSRLFGDVFKSELLYNSTAKTWFVYDGLRWREDVGGICAAKKARIFADILMMYAFKLTNDPEISDEIKKCFKEFVWKYQSLHCTF